MDFMGCKDGMLTSNSKIADLKGLRKDHEVTNDPVKGPPLRPICGASESMNAPLSEILGKIIDVVAEIEDEKQDNICGLEVHII